MLDPVYMETSGSWSVRFTQCSPVRDQCSPVRDHSQGLAVYAGTNQTAPAEPTSSSGNRNYEPLLSDHFLTTNGRGVRLRPGPHGRGLHRLLQHARPWDVLR